MRPGTRIQLLAIIILLGQELEHQTYQRKNHRDEWF